MKSWQFTWGPCSAPWEVAHGLPDATRRHFQFAPASHKSQNTTKAAGTNWKCPIVASGRTSEALQSWVRHSLILQICRYQADKEGPYRSLPTLEKHGGKHKKANHFIASCLLESQALGLSSSKLPMLKDCLHSSSPGFQAGSFQA